MLPGYSRFPSKLSLVAATPSGTGPGTVVAVVVGTVVGVGVGSVVGCGAGTVVGVDEGWAAAGELTTVVGATDVVDWPPVPVEADEGCLKAAVAVELSSEELTPPGALGGDEAVLGATPLGSDAPAARD